MGDQYSSNVREKIISGAPERTSSEAQHPNKTLTEGNLVYDDAEEEPELHMRTYVALASMFLLNLVQVFALQGPPAVVRSFDCYIYALLSLIALLHWNEPRQLSSRNVGSELAVTSTGCHLSTHLVCIRHIPSSEAASRWVLGDQLHWGSYCPWVWQYLQTHVSLSRNSDRDNKSLVQ